MFQVVLVAVRTRSYCQTLFLLDSLLLFQFSADVAFQLLFSLQLLTQMPVLGS